MKLATLSLNSTHFSSIAMTTIPRMSPEIQLKPKKVAVIGAGAAGLVAARELRREGHRVVVFERGAQPGGTWVYTPEVESDSLGLHPSRTFVHSSLYHSLRTNLPREVMGFRDFPFLATGTANRDSRRFPGHQEVLRYLEDFARKFGINELVRYQTEVGHVELEVDGKWKVRSKRKAGDDTKESDEIYEAVVVCSGHYTQPRIAEISGVELWPGKQIHSHNYRNPECYQDLVVVLIGSSASAVDISRDIGGVAKEVHMASRSTVAGPYGKLPGYHNIWLHPMIEKAHEDGRVSFQDGSMMVADVILHCTGYKYHFPFLRTNEAVNVDDNRVGPLYQHVFPPALAPGISFIGIPFKVVPFILFELQSKWVAGILSGRVSIPSQEVMMDEVQAFYSNLKAIGVPKRYTHELGDNQFDYDNWLAAEAGSPLVEEWRKRMYFATGLNRKNKPDSYRDEWDDHELISQAYQDFLQYVPQSTSLTACFS